MRSRNVKPGFFQNETLAELPPETRLLFIGLWCIADREGRLEDRPKRIKMQIFPADTFNVDLMLADLNQAGLIIRYEANGGKYIEIPKFLEHQKPHHQERTSIIPPYPSHLGAKDFEPTCESIALIPDRGFLIADCGIPNGADALPVPEGLNLEAWTRFETYRRGIKKPIKQPSTLAAMRKLVAFGSDQAAVVEQTIANGWQGLFALRDDNGRTPRKTRYDELVEKLGV